jgi:hypothetical protein
MNATQDKEKSCTESMIDTLGGGQAYDRSSDYVVVTKQSGGKYDIICSASPGLAKGLEHLLTYLLTYSMMQNIN